MNIDMAALHAIVVERGISFDDLLEDVKAAVLSAYRHSEGHQPDAHIEIDRKTGAVQVFARELDDDGTVLSFADQRTFGGWLLADLVTVDGSVVPVPVAHLARDPLDPRFDTEAVVKVLRRKHSELKRQLLDQTVVSGIGNIYADEALWRAKVHGARIAATLTRRQLAAVLDAAADVMRDALAKGGTSFDSLYVNVNGESGYFDRSLDAYGREGEPCRRCGAVLRREKFMNRSSFYCPRCQPPPRR